MFLSGDEGSPKLASNDRSVLLSFVASLRGGTSSNALRVTSSESFRGAKGGPLPGESRAGPPVSGGRERALLERSVRSQRRSFKCFRVARRRGFELRGPTVIVLTKLVILLAITTQTTHFTVNAIERNPGNTNYHEHLRQTERAPETIVLVDDNNAVPSTTGSSAGVTSNAAQMDPTTTANYSTGNENTALNQSDSQQPVEENNDAWVNDENARQQVANFLFTEFREQNFNRNLTKFNQSDLNSLSLGYGPSYGSPALISSLTSLYAGSSSSNFNDGLLLASAAGEPEQAGAAGSDLIGRLNSSAGAVLNGSSGSSPAAAGSQSRPYFGDALQYFQSVYWPIHCVTCLVICTLGIFANVTNIIVLTRPNMITAVNTILSAMAFTDLVVNISTIPYLIHQLSDSTNLTSYHSFQWAVYILIHAHTSVTAHTISIWLTCALATWRYFVVCRSQSSNQRNWSVALAKRTVVGVFLFVPCFCIPNYLCFAIVKDVTERNSTIYRVGFSELAEESDFIKTFHFWIFSCLTKLVPCVLLSFFTTVLIRKLLSARERRLRLLASFGNNKQLSKEYDESQLAIVPNGGSGSNSPKSEASGGWLRAKKGSPGGKKQQASLGERDKRREENMIIFREHNHCNSIVNNNNNNIKSQEGAPNNNKEPTKPKNPNSSADNETTNISYSSNLSSGPENQHPQQPRILSQLIVESTATNNTTSISNTKMLAACDTKQSSETTIYNNLLAPEASEPRQRSLVGEELGQRAASSCGPAEYQYSSDNNVNSDKSNSTRPLILSSMTASQQELPNNNTNSDNRHKSINSSNTANFLNSSTANIINGGSAASALPARVGGSNINFKLNEKRSSETIFNGLSKSTNDINSTRGRSVGSTTLNPIHMVKIHATQKQITQNETTTRLLIAVMIVFLICEFPAGILAALCAILGQDFWENVYHQIGFVTDLLALINSSVNFILYCFMSTQFRITFYRVVLHCPAPNMPEQKNSKKRGLYNQNENHQVITIVDDCQNHGQNHLLDQDNCGQEIERNHN